ncbi:cytochrome c3 family protein [Calderihabitans maritimus]|uniref:Cytochrome C family protein n=1 Tax=Calderihabitans maritimus TaxID=1246530 RepID=A0A1Z5HW16_9FIRM|nr:cytochrome c3 family protein [Calderihabitans maritimus]GAW93598.1 cytochrome C family protein [Calderihabitans maritimus]
MMIDLRGTVRAGRLTLTVLVLMALGSLLRISTGFGQYYPEPHGSYTSDTQFCAQCHTSHGAEGEKLINESSVTDLCYVCHSTVGQSVYDQVYDEFSKTYRHPVPEQVISCNNCHNPHLTPVSSPRILQASVNETVYYQGGGEKFCWSCHPAEETYYPQDGSGHDAGSLEPVSGTGISCNGCHEQHGSQYPYLLYLDNDRTLCYDCHSASSGSGWEGKSVYEDTYINAHESYECSSCHDPHGGPEEKYLIASYDMNASVNRSVYFDANDFKTCFRSNCHTETEILGSGSGFYDDQYNRNLHELHLDDTSKGTAVCRECHRPHGPLTAENPYEKHLVGFPAGTVSAYIYDDPTYKHNYNSIEGGACFLSCHDVNHDETNSVYRNVY